MGIKPLASPSYSPSRSSLERTLKCPVLFSLISILLLYLYSWPQRWLISGAPILQVFILLGDYHGNRILPDIHIWPIFTTLHLIYAISSTSWLLYWVFAGLCYPAIFLVCLFQFRVVSNGVRRGLRSGLKHLHFIDDKIAFFSIPALEIDNEVDGLMVLRGITFSLSSLSFVVHGAEVGIKLSNDMELAIQSEEVTVYLFRGIDIGDCFANLKGGRYEMTFGELEGKSKDADGDEVFVEGTPLLKAASRGSDGRSLEINEGVQEKKGKMKDEMTNGSSPEATSAKEGLESIEKLSPDDEEAAGRYQKHISFIEETSSIYEAKENVKRLASKNPEFQSKFSAHDTNPLRAAICSQLHSKPSVPHPPQKSIKVTTLQNLMPPAIRAFIHRLPMLLRLLLNPLAYFHPVKITSITATASGQWLDSLLVSKLFQDYGEHDSEIRNLKSRISSWLSDANFAIELGAITGLAQVPFIPTYDITCQLIFNDVMAYRALPKHVDLKQVVRLGGADAKSLRLCSAVRARYGVCGAKAQALTFVVPSFLLPHHEHLLPPVPSPSRKQSLEHEIETADGKPAELQAEHALSQAEADETNVKISAHARLPAVFDQELLDFIAALVKASKVVEMEKEPSAMDNEVSGLREFGHALKGGLKEGVKKAVVDGVVNERWIAKMVGKVTKKLEVARGEAGYSGDIPVKLGGYRTGAVEREGEKLLP